MQHDRPDDEGFSLVEVLVAMAMLTVLALSFLPLLVSSLKLTARGSSIASASQLVDATLSAARGQTQTCAALTSYAAGVATSVTAGDGTVLLASASPPVCSGGTARFTATVKAGGTLQTLASATTLIYVSSS